MDWKTSHARLTPEEARAQLLALLGEPTGPSIIGRHPYRALAIALATGFLFAKTVRLWSAAGSGGLWLIQRVLPLPFKPRATALDRIKARARLVD